jgi:Aspartyl protease
VELAAGDARNETLKKVLLTACFIACVGVSKRSPLAAPVTISFEPVRQLIMLEVHVNGAPRPLSFVLDTGDKYTIIDIARAKELGLAFGKEIHVRGTGAEIMGAFVENAKFSIASFSGYEQPVTLAIPLRPLAARIGHDFDGVLGSDFIEQFVVEIDYRAKRVRLHDRNSFRYAGSGQSIPIRIDGSGHPIFKAEVALPGMNPIPVDLALDIGSTGSLDLNAPFVAEHRLPGANVHTVREIGAAGAGGTTQGRVGRVSSLKFAGFDLRDPITVFSSDKSGGNASRETQGKIGARIASRFKVFLDYGHDRIIFEPYSNVNDPFDVAVSGVAIEADGKDYKTFRIAEVLEDSAASDAHLLPGDVIEAIDAQPASELTLTQVVAMFERVATYRLSVRRDGKVIDVQLTPRRDI